MLSRGDVFGKQARLHVFAEFLLFLLVFPGEHTCVGVTVKLLGAFLVVCFVSPVPSGIGTVNIRRDVRSDLHVCLEKGVAFLITHISIVTPMLAWDGPVGLEG